MPRERQSAGVAACLWIDRTKARSRDPPPESGKGSPFPRASGNGRKTAFGSACSRRCRTSRISKAMIDATIRRVHRHGAGAKGGLKTQAIGRSRGGLTTKIGARVDALGNLRATASNSCWFQAVTPSSRCTAHGRHRLRRISRRPSLRRQQNARASSILVPAWNHSRLIRSRKLCAYL